MSTKDPQNSRRQFLRNTALAGLSVGFLPTLLKAAPEVSEKIANSCDPTTLDYYGQGPFYTANAPELENSLLAAENEPGTRLILSGMVQTLDCSSPIPNALIDIWHANHDGAYDNVGYNLRGKTYSNDQGFYLFETILPGKYLNGASYRPSHIHFKITPPGFPTIITQLYFEGDTDIPGDAAASITSGIYDATSRIIPIEMNDVGQYEGTWDISVDGSGVLGVADVHLDKGLIYSVSPNPFIDRVEINYGVFKNSKVSLEVFSFSGNLIALIDEQQLQPGKYNAVWVPDADLASGVYLVRLKINDFQVHYSKMIKA